ncbi:hypothetical protein RF11_14401 [Thelohanellus kitauei]|uniref:Uncharacterized protein n=1 Tax=Thelohanellus kitauei TaxID=669202 RepID=A0A0C2J8N6_THEKT|nr:hypothetical protein RF11_14401 [Thelohanellus kitauei]
MIQLPSRFGISSHNHFFVVKKITRVEIYFVDEMDFNVSMRLKKSRLVVGTTRILRILKIRSKNVSVGCAKKRDCVVYKDINSRPYNGESFQGYIENFFRQG